MSIRKFLVVSASTFPLFGPIVALAQVGGTGGDASHPIFENLKDVFDKFLCPVFGWLFAGAMVLGVIFAVMAGIQYITAGGNPEKATKANKTLLYAVVGLAIALLAKGVPTIVASFFGSSLGGVCG